MPKLFLLSCFKTLITITVTTSITIHATSSWAQTEPLTLQRALELAFRANPRLAAASSDIAAAEGAIQQAGVLPNPELATSIEDKNAATRTTTVQINQAIELGGKRSARINAAKGARDVAQAEWKVKRAELYSTVTTAFYATLIAQERHRLAQASFELAKQASSVAAKRVTAGKISPVESTKAQIAEAGAKLELAQAVNALTQSQRQLAATWGSQTASIKVKVIDANTSLNLPNVPNLETLMQRLQHSPLLTQARLEVTRQEALQQVERSRRIGDLTLNVGTKRDREADRNQLIVGFAIPLPLFDRNQGNLQQALHHTEKARSDLAATEIQLQSELIQAHEKLTTLHHETALLKQEILPNANSAYQAAVTGFELGKFNFLELLDAQRTLFQTKNQYLNALSETYRAAAEIERIVGTDTFAK